MRLLVDTHALLWWATADRRLSKPARAAIASAGEPLIGAGTMFEMAVKASVGKLELPPDWTVELLDRERFAILPILPLHAHTLATLAFVSVNGSELRDPFDRLLVAQADAEDVPVVTRDPAIAAHGVPTIW
ncbi:MAG: type II toxin-antitoxin system VapC family toxin [Solirubrobacterales bacterium]|nr:type II toxin-antitoxin system VapC family toxin [Solirubrobacterales bacterium]